MYHLQTLRCCMSSFAEQCLKCMPAHLACMQGALMHLNAQTCSSLLTFAAGHRCLRDSCICTTDAGPSRADTEPRWGNKFVPSSSGGGFEDRDRGGGFGDRDRTSSRGEDTWGRRPSEGEPPAAGGETTAAPGHSHMPQKKRSGPHHSVSFLSQQGQGVKHGCCSRSFRVRTGMRESKLIALRASECWCRATGVLSAILQTAGVGRPRLKLAPRTKPLPVLEVAPESKAPERPPEPEPEPLPLPSGPPKPRTNPFGAARPREEVLKEKGVDPVAADKEPDREVPNE